VAAGNRPQLHKVWEELRQGDVLVVWKLDPLSRSLKDLLRVMERVRASALNARVETVDTRALEPFSVPVLINDAKEL
jgi:DNA invertase Pin-like site-specific DNA recombinase